MNDQTPPITPVPLPGDYESALAELEALVQRMECGDLPLEQSITSYQRGVELARVCQQRLDQAEQQVKVLQGQLLRPLSGIDAAED